MVKSYVEVRNRFKKLIDSLVNRAKSVAEAEKNEGPAEPIRLDKNGWSGDLLDVEDLAKPFDRNENATDLQRAITDVAAPGTQGDVMASVLQGDVLATFERAYRLRQMPYTRLRIHSGGRAVAAGADGGVYRKAIQGLVSDTVARAKDIAEDS